MDRQAALKYLQSVVKDTSAEILLVQQEMWEKFSDEKRLLLTMELMDNNMELLRANILRKHPQWSREEVQVEILRTLYKDNYSEEDFEQLIKSVREYHSKVSQAK
jgi:hypothetical protein